MNKTKTTFSIFVFLCFLLTQPLLAQENENNGSKFGFGVHLFDIVDHNYFNDSSPLNSVLMTIDFNDKIRLEPSVGFSVSDGFDQYSIGIGIFGKKPKQNFNILYGLRLGYYSNETTKIAVISPTLGGEYFFIENFSIGCEVQLSNVLNDGDFSILTSSSVIVRFYL